MFSLGCEIRWITPLMISVSSYPTPLPFMLLLLFCFYNALQWVLYITVQLTSFLDSQISVPTVTDETWQSLVIEADGPVMVEFWAPWCGPCRIIHPVIAELSTEYGGKLKCFMLNTDESPSTVTKYGIRSIPTIIIFKNGEKKDAIIGAVPKTTLISNIKKFL